MAGFQSQALGYYLRDSFDLERMADHDHPEADVPPDCNLIPQGTPWAVWRAGLPSMVQGIACRLFPPLKVFAARQYGAGK
jgi:hypothetical protein